MREGPSFSSFSHSRKWMPGKNELQVAGHAAGKWHCPGQLGPGRVQRLVRIDSGSHLGHFLSIGSCHWGKPDTTQCPTERPMWVSLEAHLLRLANNVWINLEKDPPVPSEALKWCNSGWQLNCTIMRDLEPDAPSSDMASFPTHRTWDNKSLLFLSC